LSKKVLIVVAHPDDEVLGCFGTVEKLIKDGYEAYTLILGEGKTSRDEQRDVEGRSEEISELRKEILKANETIKIKKTFVENFPDNRFDEVALLDIVKVVSKVIDEVQPEMIFTHFENDLNIDHQITYKAVLTATRPMENCFVKEIYSFEILSSTEWNFPLSFSPDTFFEVEIENKQKAMSIYKSELREFPHPRSLEGIELNAKYWGMRVGKKYVEAFKTVRKLR
jgi:LmbE family N-acetylglucosaminyl deacetylase